MICIMHECVPYGNLALNGKPMDTASLARLSGETEETIKRLLEELESAGVFSRTKDGCIYSRRMIKDEALREERSTAGKLGGNPHLIKQKVNPFVNHQDNQKVKPYLDITLSCSKAKLQEQVKPNLTPSSSSSISSLDLPSAETKKEVGEDVAVVTTTQRDDDCPQNEEEWAAYFVLQDGGRRKVWPFFTAWYAARVTIRQVAQAIGAAREKSSEPIACLPAYVDRILASQAQECKQGRKPNSGKQTALEAHNAHIANQWLSAAEVQNASAG